MSTAGINKVNSNIKSVQKDASISHNKNSINGAYGKNRGCTTSCGLRLPKRSDLTATRLIKHLGGKFAKGLRLVVMRKRSPQPKVSSSGRSQPSVIPVDSHRTEAIEDCIEFINSSSSFTRSNSTSAKPINLST